MNVEQAQFGPSQEFATQLHMRKQYAQSDCSQRKQPLTTSKSLACDDSRHSANTLTTEWDVVTLYTTIHFNPFTADLGGSTAKV